MPIYRGTHYIIDDEPCLGLYELNFKSPDQRSRRRYQIIIVIRNDKPAEYRQDLGLAKNFGADQFRIPGGVVDDVTGKVDILHTVGELKDIANIMRNKPAFNKQELAQVSKIKT